MIFFFLLWLRLHMTMSLEQISYCSHLSDASYYNVYVRQFLHYLYSQGDGKFGMHSWQKSGRGLLHFSTALWTVFQLIPCCIKWWQTSRHSPSIILHSYGSFLPRRYSTLSPDFRTLQLDNLAYAAYSQLFPHLPKLLLLHSSPGTTA
jgi:hypothetical protein